MNRIASPVASWERSPRAAKASQRAEAMIPLQNCDNCVPSIGDRLSEGWPRGRGRIGPWLVVPLPFVGNLLAKCVPWPNGRWYNICYNAKGRPPHCGHTAAPSALPAGGVRLLRPGSNPDNTRPGASAATTAFAPGLSHGASRLVGEFAARFVPYTRSRRAALHVTVLGGVEGQALYLHPSQGPEAPAPRRAQRRRPGSEPWLTPSLRSARASRGPKSRPGWPAPAL